MFLIILIAGIKHVEMTQHICSGLLISLLGDKGGEAWGGGFGVGRLTLSPLLSLPLLVWILSLFLPLPLASLEP
jgi:hypothetical protein